MNGINNFLIIAYLFGTSFGVNNYVFDKPERWATVYGNSFSVSDEVEIITANKVHRYMLVDSNGNNIGFENSWITCFSKKIAGSARPFQNPQKSRSTTNGTIYKNGPYENGSGETGCFTYDQSNLYDYNYGVRFKLLDNNGVTHDLKSYENIDFHESSYPKGTSIFGLGFPPNRITMKLEVKEYDKCEHCDQDYCSFDTSTSSCKYIAYSCSNCGMALLSGSIQVTSNIESHCQYQIDGSCGGVDVECYIGNTINSEKCFASASIQSCTLNTSICSPTNAPLPPPAYPSPISPPLTPLGSLYINTGEKCPTESNIATIKYCKYHANTLGYEFRVFNSLNFTGCVFINEHNIDTTVSTGSKNIYVYSTPAYNYGNLPSVDNFWSQYYGCGGHVIHCVCSTDSFTPPSNPPYLNPSPPPGSPPYPPLNPLPPSLPNTPSNPYPVSPPLEKSPPVAPAPPIYPSPDLDLRCNGNYNTQKDCVADLTVVNCAALHCNKFERNTVFLAQQKCLVISKPFHIAFIKAKCVSNIDHSVNINNNKCLKLIDGYGMGEWVSLYSSDSGFILSSVLKKKYDEKLPYNTAPSTDDTCEGVIPINRGYTISIDYSSQTKVYFEPNDFYLLEKTATPSPPPLLNSPLPPPPFPLLPPPPTLPPLSPPLQPPSSPPLDCKLDFLSYNPENWLDPLVVQDGNLVQEFTQMEYISKKIIETDSVDPYACLVESKSFYCLDIGGYSTLNNYINSSKYDLTKSSMFDLNTLHDISNEIDNTTNLFGLKDTCNGKIVGDGIINVFDLGVLMYYIFGDAPYNLLDRNPSVINTVNGRRDSSLLCNKNISKADYLKEQRYDICSSSNLYSLEYNNLKKVTNKVEIRQLRVKTLNYYFEESVIYDNGKWVSINVNDVIINIEILFKNIDLTAELSNELYDSEAVYTNKPEVRFTRTCGRTCHYVCSLIEPVFTGNMAIYKNSLQLSQRPIRRSCHYIIHVWIPSSILNVNEKVFIDGISVLNGKTGSINVQTRYATVLESPSAPPPFLPPSPSPSPPPPLYPPLPDIYQSIDGKMVNGEYLLNVTKAVSEKYTLTVSNVSNTAQLFVGSSSFLYSWSDLNKRYEYHYFSVMDEVSKVSYFNFLKNETTFSEMTPVLLKSPPPSPPSYPPSPSYPPPSTPYWQLQTTQGECEAGYLEPTVTWCKSYANKIGIKFRIYNSLNFTGCAYIKDYDPQNIKNEYSIVFSSPAFPHKERNSSYNFWNQNFGCGTRAIHCICVKMSHTPPFFPPLLNPVPLPLSPPFPLLVHQPPLNPYGISKPPPSPSSPPAVSPPYYPSPNVENRCNGDVNPLVDCGAELVIGDCPNIWCDNFEKNKIFLPQQKCLLIDKPFHIAFIKASCVSNLDHSVNKNNNYCLTLLNNYGMGNWLNIYSSESGLILSSVLKSKYDSRLPFNNAPSTNNECERVIPVNTGYTMKIHYTPETRVFFSPGDYYKLAHTGMPLPPPPSFPPFVPPLTPPSTPPPSPPPPSPPPSPPPPTPLLMLIYTQQHLQFVGLIK